MTWFGLHPDMTAVPLDDLLAHGEPDSRAVILFPSVEALKNNEDALVKLGVDTDPIVAHRERPPRVFAQGTDVNTRRFGTAKLDGIGNQILKDLQQLRSISQHHWQSIILRERSARLLDGQL